MYCLNVILIWMLKAAVCAVLSFKIFNTNVSFAFSILNKLTPEKFDKLCLELLNVGVDSKVVLKGIILLVSIFLTAVLLFIEYLKMGS